MIRSETSVIGPLTSIRCRPEAAHCRRRRMVNIAALLLRTLAFVGALLVINPTDHLSAQKTSSLASQYNRTDFTVEDGLPDNVVNAVLQAGNGLLWVGTGSGLSTFDGREFKRIDLSFPGVPSQGSVHALAQSPNGDLWVGTDAGLVLIPQKGLSQLNPAAASFFALGNDEVVSLLFTRQGALWVGTNHGLYRRDSPSFRKSSFNGPVNRLGEASNGHLLILGEHGFAEFDGERVTERPELPRRLGVRDDQIFNVFQDSRGTTWYGTFRGVIRESQHPFPLPQPGGSRRRSVYRTYEDPQGKLWISADGGTFRIDENRLEPLAPGVGARCFFASPDGDIWMGTNGAGLLHFRPRIVQMYTKADGLPSNIVMAVLADHLGRLWIGNNCGGLTLFMDGRWKRYSEKDGLTNSCVWSLAEDRKGDLWIGTYNGSLFQFHNGHFQAYSIEHGLPSKIILQIVVDRDDSLWIATPNGLSHMEKGHFTNYTTAQGLSSNHILCVHQDHSGTIWVASEGGLDTLTASGFVPVASSGNTEGSIVASFLETSRGDLYTGQSSRGIGLIKSNQLAVVDNRLSVMDMRESANHDLWFSSKNGVIRVALDDLDHAVTDRNAPLDYEMLDRADGLNSTQSSSGTPNIAITPDHKLWIATVKGLAMVDLNRLPVTSQRANVYVSDVKIDGVVQPTDTELTLPSGSHHVELHLAAVDLGSPEKTRVQYRMDGVDSNWLDSDISRTAVYTAIPAGKHTFHLRATGSDGKWDRLGVTYNIVQDPLFYQRRWVQLLCVALAFGTASGLYIARVRYIVGKTRVVAEARIAEREDLARDLHDTLLQGVQGLVLRFHDAIQDTPARSKTRGSLESALEVADAVVIEARNRVTQLRSEIPDTPGLFHSLQKFGAEQNSKDNLRFRIAVRGTVVPLQHWIEKELFLIGREAIRNVFLHAQATEVDVDIDYGRTFLRLSCRDNGIGMDSSVLGNRVPNGHWGLVGMYERSDKIGGELTVRSQSGSGTEIGVVVPAGRAYVRRHFTLRSTVDHLLSRPSDTSRRT